MPNWQRWKNIQKCYPFEEKRLNKWQPPYIIQPKFDGIRCRAVPTESGYILLSSEENIIFSVPHINEAVNRLRINLELDGELYIHNASFEEITSITQRTVNIHPDYKRMQFHIFDIVNEKSQMERTIQLENLSQRFESPLVKTPYWLANNLQEVMEVFKELISYNYEGIIVRNVLGPYERKRSTNVMKFKPKQSDEYEIIGTQEEISINGTAKGTLGALVCKSGDGNIFNVGTGFNNMQRETYWINKDKLIGRKVKVQYQHITSGKQVPRFPVFVEVI